MAHPAARTRDASKAPVLYKSGLSQKMIVQRWDYCSPVSALWSGLEIKLNKVKTSQELGRYTLVILHWLKTATKAEVKGKAKKTSFLPNLPGYTILPCSSPDIPGEGKQICWYGGVGAPRLQTCN